MTGIQAVLHSDSNLRWKSDLIGQGEVLKSAIEKFKRKVDKYDMSLGADVEREKAVKFLGDPICVIKSGKGAESSYLRSLRLCWTSSSICRICE